MQFAHAEEDYMFLSAISLQLCFFLILLFHGKVILHIQYLSASLISLFTTALVLFASESLLGEKKFKHIAHLVPSYV